MSSGARDPSTLAALHPTQPRELHYRDFKSSMRLHGSHFMTLRRASRLPESSREYRSGDPINMIDWKAFARTDQLIIREIRDEATARVRIGVDIGETMLWPDAEVPAPALPPTKAEVALRVALNVAHVHLRMGDLVELWLFGADGAAGAKALRLKPRSPVDLVTSFERMALAGFAAPDVQREFVAHEPDERPCDVAFWVGDALGDADFAGFLRGGRRGFLMHVLSSLELAIDWVQSDTSYFDEGGERKEYQGQVLKHRSNYLSNLDRWRKGLEADLLRRGGFYLGVSDATKVAEYQAALQDFLKRPKQL